MVKRVLMVVLLVSLAGTAAAQRVQMGVRAGLFSQDMDFRMSDLNTALHTDARLGWHAALVTRIRITAIGSGSFAMGFYLQPEIVYSQNGYKMQEAGSKVSKVSMRSVDVPVLLSFQLAVIRIQAGPVFNLMYKTPSRRGDMELMSTKPTIGYGLGASVDIWKGLVVDFRYNGEIKKLTNSLDTGDGTFQSVKGSLSNWSLGIGWMF